jgi:hypothetical protein
MDVTRERKGTYPQESNNGEKGDLPTRKQQWREGGLTHKEATRQRRGTNRFRCNKGEKGGINPQGSNNGEKGD